jgi:hypothetical protein
MHVLIPDVYGTCIGEVMIVVGGILHLYYINEVWTYLCIEDLCSSCWYVTRDSLGCESQVPCSVPCAVPICRWNSGIECPGPSGGTSLIVDGVPRTTLLVTAPHFHMVLNIGMQVSTLSMMWENVVLVMPKWASCHHRVFLSVSMTQFPVHCTWKCWI